MACHQCEHLTWCHAHVWEGALLPCQPGEQEMIANARETADFVKLWQDAPQMVTLPRTNTRANRHVERPIE